MGMAAIIGIFLFGTMVNLTVETAAELTAEILADTDIGIAAGPHAVSLTSMVDTTPGAMLILASPSAS
jgi:hypothetical protein